MDSHTDRHKVTDSIDHPTCASATTAVGNDEQNTAM